MWPAAMLVRAIFLLCLVVGSRQFSISEVVVPVAQLAGEDVELQCRIDFNAKPEGELVVKWWWTPRNGSVDKIHIYQRVESNRPVPLRVDFIQVKDNDSVVIVNATPAYSGVYECEASIGFDEYREHGELTIYTPGSRPQLNVSEVADGPDDDSEPDVRIECSAEGVAPAPDIALSIDGVEVNMTETVVGPDSAGLFDVVGVVTRTKADVDGYPVTCELFYIDTNITHERYLAELVYYASGAPPTTESAEPAASSDVANDSMTSPSGKSCVNSVSWILLLVLCLLSQVPTLKSSM